MGEGDHVMKTDDDIINDLDGVMKDYEPFVYDEDNYTGEEPEEDDVEDDEVGKSELDATVDIEKTDAKKGLVFGWASVIKKNGVVVSDLQGDQIESDEDMENAAYDFTMSSRVGGEEHVRKGVSTLIESMAFTDEKCEALGLPDDFPRGWWVGFKITDKEVMKGMAAKRYTQFSVHGVGKRTPINKAKKGDGLTYNDRREAVTNAIKAMYPATVSLTGTPSYVYCWVSDMDDTDVIYQAEIGGKSSYYKASWSIDEDGIATIGEPIEVRSKTTYVKKSDYDPDQIEDVISRFNSLKRRK